MEIKKILCTFVYAANGAKERRELWKDLQIYKRIVSNQAWIMIGDMNVTLNPNEHSAGSSCMTSDMNEFVNNIEMEDVEEENLLFQKAKIRWLKVGDRNNAYFHKVIKSRNHKNMINVVRDVMGNLYQGEYVAEQFVNHFHKEVCDEEIKEAMFQIDGNKAPGPDGLSFLFFKKAWDIVGGHVCRAVKVFFANGKMLREINSTLISLILKTQTPEKVIDFRPIACCNVIHKCISKIMTNRIKRSLRSIVGQYQSAFVPTRHIQDNILLSQELLKGYDRKDGPNRVAMKIDIQKSYDTVNWKFLEAIL
ncbi:RNA-directed DNA polymerase, eukaryota, reverse transcriptase zinc-binding domain protein [Tanacetum coccineum]